MQQVRIKYYIFTYKNLVCQVFCARPEVLTVASLNVHVFWDVTPYHGASSSPFPYITAPSRCWEPLTL